MNRSENRDSASRKNISNYALVIIAFVIVAGIIIYSYVSSLKMRERDADKKETILKLTAPGGDSTTTSGVLRYLTAPKQ